MRSRPVALGPLRNVIARTAFVASLTASVAVGLTGAGGRSATVLAASSSPFASSSPATTIVTAPSEPASTAPTVTTVPPANTGEAWASPWFAGLLALTVLLGLACVAPALGRREEPTT